MKLLKEVGFNEEDGRKILSRDLYYGFTVYDTMCSLSEHGMEERFNELIGILKENGFSDVEISIGYTNEKINKHRY